MKLKKLSLSFIMLSLLSFSSFLHAEECDTVSDLDNDIDDILQTTTPFVGQFVTNKGKVTFSSSTAIEDIKSLNSSVGAAMDLTTGKVAMVIDMKKFEFDKSVMKEHFNGTSFLDTDHFPKASFSGVIQELSKLNLTTAGAKKVKIKGPLTIHGITKIITVEGTLEGKSGKVEGKAKFVINTADFGVKIPFIQQAMISESIEIEIDINMNPSTAKK